MDYDYVIVGAGSAGCALAARLSEDPSVTVALLEAGGPDDKNEIHVPAAFAKLFKTEYDWDFTTAKQTELDGRDRTEDVDHVMDCLAAPANIEAAIGYYRAMLDPSRLIDRYAAEQAAASAVGELPVLYLRGAEDGCLGADVIDLDAVRAALPPDSRAEFVPGAGHFLQLDRPNDVNAHILDWLR
jgi:pimeloyl-ACP methyl ester carboxylesterase